MQAKETKLQDILEGTKQYVIPLFQRTYSWESKEWEALWKDLIDLCEAENPRSHFIGSIVNMPTTSVPEGVAKYLLIDGQQRLTTIFILLTLLRDKAKNRGHKEFAEEIHNTLLVNPYKKDHDLFKLMPTQIDRDAYKNLIRNESDANRNDNSLMRAYAFFDRKLKQSPIQHEQLKKVITSYLSVVSIVLDVDDNPHLVFESLNAKGKPLTQADLIRNYFFMRIDIDRQEEVYTDYWQPMQTSLSDVLTEYMRHFLMMDGNIVKQSDVYSVLKERVSIENAIDYLNRLKGFSNYYKRLIDPDDEPEIELRKYFRRLKRLEVTTVYPLLLNLYGAYANEEISKHDFVDILRTIENYLIRRFVCNEPTNQLNKIFPAIYPQLSTKHKGDFLKGVQSILQNKGYPKDTEFYSAFKDKKFYGAADRIVKTKLILETIEENFAHKEAAPVENLTIEHVMPQTLSPWWKEHLGQDCEATHELYLHTIGNLTLSAYNPELSNFDYATKQKIYQDSHIDLNRYFLPVTSWTRSEIEKRSHDLANIALEIWSYFGEKNLGPCNFNEVTGTTPTRLHILGQQFEVRSWRDVLEQTLNTVVDLEPSKFELITRDFPRYIGRDSNKFRSSRELENGYFVEVNLSAKNIERFCRQVIEAIELTSEEWSVTTEAQL